ncbi:MAG: TetR/AcrR family transcriptional regulator [Planctomycetota bacterium]
MRGVMSIFRKQMMFNNDKRKQIMRVVEELAANRRFHEITLDEVAEAAEIGKGTIYHYFKDKEDLFFQTATSGFDELCELLRQTVPCNTLFSEKLLSVCKQIIRFFRTRRQLLQMMQSEGCLIYWRQGKIRQQWVAKRKLLINTLAEILSDGIAEGAVRSDIPVEVSAVFLLELLRTQARELGPAVDNTRSDKLLVDLFMHGVSVPADKLSLRQMAVKKVN